MGLSNEERMSNMLDALHRLYRRPGAQPAVEAEKPKPKPRARAKKRR